MFSTSTTEETKGVTKYKVALKILKPEISADKETIERFRNELKYARKISHKNVCRMYELVDMRGTITSPWSMSMEKI